VEISSGQQKKARQSLRGAGQAAVQAKRVATQQAPDGAPCAARKQRKNLRGKKEGLSYPTFTRFFSRR